MITRSAFALPLLMIAAPAFAWTPPPVGKACSGTRGPGPELVAIAGNYLGGRPVRDGVVDRKSFQACFQTVSACQDWLAGKAVAFPLAPGFATCTPVTLR